jgi:integrase
MMDLTKSALIRGWIQGVGWDVLGELYLGDADKAEVMRVVRQIRDQLALKAQRLGLDNHAGIWANDREYSQDWIKKALESVKTLQALSDPIPQVSDPYSLWLPPGVVAKLAGLKIKRLQELAEYINARGGSWWNSIPKCGQQSAETIQGFFDSHKNNLGIVLNLQALPMVLEISLSSNSIVPLERFAPPSHLSGEAGSNRADLSRCRIDARNDYEALLAWLSMWEPGSPTHRAYRKEAERFLLWSVLEIGKPLSSLTTPDCANYRRFLSDPLPAERWIGKPAQRWSVNWRPFKGPLKSASVRQAEVILGALCEWLVGQRYLDSNPFAGLSTQSFSRKSQGTDRALSKSLWEHINGFALKQINNEFLTDGQRASYRRIRFVMSFAYHTGLRLHEMVYVKTGDLRLVSAMTGEQWWLDVIGKRQKYREVPISPEIMHEINAQLRDRGLRPVGFASAETAIIGKLRGESREAISASALYQALKAFFKEAADEMVETNPIHSERLLKASTHWLRHTHGSHAVANGVPLAIIRDNLGHANIATTSIYVHTDRDERYQAMVNMGTAVSK